MTDMPAIDYWLPWWWDHIGRGFPHDSVELNLVQQNVNTQGTVLDHGGLPPGGGLGGGPPPAAGSAAVAVDEETIQRIRRLKRAKERRERMMRR